jgi:polysaccharide biosynthesis protein PslA
MLDTQASLAGAGESERAPPVVTARHVLDSCPIWKVMFDHVLAFALLILCLVPMLVIGLLIKFDSPGPVFFRQPRAGRSNNVFQIWKFRTMYHRDADLQGLKLTERDDPRVTGVGTWLRRLSLDELPQLLNVLAGDMSLVGPRPHALEAGVGQQRYADLVPNYHLRHTVKPGLTGWAQVNGWRGETVTINQIAERVRHDLEYIHRQSLALDILIILKTIVLLKNYSAF